MGFHISYTSRNYLSMKMILKKNKNILKIKELLRLIF